MSEAFPKDAITNAARADVAGLEKAHASYGTSWKNRGGVGAFMMLARKWDRLENAVRKVGFNIFTAIIEDKRAEGIMDDIRDLRRYLLLVESEFTVSEVAKEAPTEMQMLHREFPMKEEPKNAQLPPYWAELTKLREFKTYVHKRLDEARVPANPQPPKHALEGCRIGDRLDWALGRMERIDRAPVWCPDCQRWLATLCDKHYPPIAIEPRKLACGCLGRCEGHPADERDC